MRFRFLAASVLLAAASPSLAASDPQPEPWAFEESDLPLDPAFQTGTLDNGMRYIIRRNATPEGTGVVRMVIGSGSLAETDDERGFAHYVEHMAFNGSTNVPEGEMIKLLEREGLAFGADTNASTGLEETTYKLDLPRNDIGLLETALMLMRETASELTFDPEAVERERGIILAEKRDRTNFALRNLEDRFEFLTPGARYAQRLPAGVEDTLNAATAEGLRGYWAREYVPANTTLVVVGDFDLETVEAMIAERFASWAPAPLPAEPATGPVALDRAGETDIFVDPALNERITASRHGPHIDRPDTVANRRASLLRQIGYGIVNRRLRSKALGEEPPFRGAGIGTGAIFEDGRTSNLVVDTAVGGWRAGLEAAVETYRSAFAYGFTEAEVAEQLANIRTSLENAVGSADTRSHRGLAAAALALVNDERIPTTPESSLARFESYADDITPDAVMEALQADFVPLENPLLRFEGREGPQGGADAIRIAWDEAAAAELPPPVESEQAEWAYTDFGQPGEVVSDQREPFFGIRQIRFANGVRLNLKPTDLQEDRVRLVMNLDGGRMLDTREAPLTTGMVRSLADGGLGAHSQDELQTILAGRSVSFSFGAAGETFRSSVTTTPRDLELQLQLLTAAITDPGYRSEAEARYRRDIVDFFAKLDATPGAALSNRLGGILSDGDPRFTLAPLEGYQALSFAQLEQDIAPRLAGGAIEIALVGDFVESEAIDLVAQTLGALPTREADFLSYADNRQRGFTADRSQRTLTHSGEPDQALIRVTWPTTDDRDPFETLRLNLLERIVRLKLTEELRERLGEAYSPSASSNQSRYYDGYGTFALAASVDVERVEEAREAIRATIAALREEPVDADTLQRARQPILERFDNALKSNGGWMALVDRAQSEPERLQRFLVGKDRLQLLDAADVQATAQRYLQQEDALEITVLPKDDPE